MIMNSIHSQKMKPDQLLAGREAPDADDPDAGGEALMCDAQYGSEVVALCLNSQLLLRPKELLQVKRLWVEAGMGMAGVCVVGYNYQS